MHLIFLILEINMKKLLVFFIIVLITCNSYGNENIGIGQTYGNVRVISYRETEREEAVKALLIGQLAHNLAQELNYKDPIYLECYLSIKKSDTNNPNYQIALQHYKYYDEKDEGSEKLIIRQQAYKYDLFSTLKLVEYAIKNTKKIREQQKWQTSGFFYDRGNNILSIPKEKIDQILKKPNSSLLNKLAERKIERPILPYQRKPSISYFWQNNTYYIYNTFKRNEESNPQDLILLTLPEIYQFEDLNLAYLIFDNDKSFYYINIKNYDWKTGVTNVSKHHAIEDTSSYDYDINKTFSNISTDNDISIYFTHEGRGAGKKRLLVYFQESDTLIQDAYTMLNRTPTNQK